MREMREFFGSEMLVREFGGQGREAHQNATCLVHCRRYARPCISPGEIRPNIPREGYGTVHTRG